MDEFEMNVTRMFAMIADTKNAMMKKIILVQKIPIPSNTYFF